MGYVQVESYNMNTETLQMIGGEKLKAIKVSIKVKEELLALEKIMSLYLDDSDVSSINRYSGISSIKVNRHTVKVIEESIKYSKLTNGVFDITLGAITKEWRAYSENQKKLQKEDILKLIPLINYKNILIDKDQNKVKLTNRGQKIDLGGIARGYAADRVIEIYKKNNIKSAVINIGENVSVLGKKNGNTPWVIGIQKPESVRGEFIGALKCENISVVTSGNYIMNLKKDNKAYGYIFDSKKGIPLENDLKSSTIVCKEAIKADALSTATFAMGSKEAINFIKKNKDISGVLITNNNEVYISFELKNFFYIIDKENFKYIYF